MKSSFSLKEKMMSANIIREKIQHAILVKTREYEKEISDE
jgi:hypothetical protein